MKTSQLAHGRQMLRAVAHATGIERLRSASVAADYDDITLVTVTFIASEAQLKAMGEFLAREGEPDTRSA
jgi:hypothetical protein